MPVLQFIIAAIGFGTIVSSLSHKEYPFLKTQINDEKHATAFNKLLNSIVKNNQKRLDAINKLTKLQATDMYPTLDTLRSASLRRGSEESSSESEEKNVIYLVIPDAPRPNSSQDTQRPVAPNSTTERPIQPKMIQKIQPERTLKQDIPIDDYSKVRGPTVQSISKDHLDALRQSIERSCKSREVKKCTKACKAAVKSTCDEYECKKKLKKRLKKNCKRECKEEFRSGW